jgi:phosphatidylserine/phosphatidylglycerophosphate/cardiolipin synthase-like enzyme
MSRTSLFVAVAVVVSFLTGCGGGSSSSATSSGAAIITLSATSLSFPSTLVGQSSAVQTVTAVNTGTASATLSSVAISGNTTDFSYVSTCGNAPVLAPGAYCTINVTFVPVAAGSFSLTITAMDNASNSPQTLTLTGTATALLPQATLSSSTIAFTSINAGTASGAQSVTLTNAGTGALTIAGIVYGGTNTDQFTQSTTCSSTLAVNASCTISATFVPTQSGTFSATVTVTDNANGVTGSTQVVTLTGTAVGPLASLSPTALTFAGTTLNTAATAQPVTLTNTGTSALTITSVSLTGTSAGLFAITANTCGSSLATSASCTISVNFTPTAAGTFTAALSLVDNAPGSPQSVSLTGVGQTSLAPIATLSSSSIAFPNTLPAGASSSVSVTLTNTGGATLNLAGIVLGGANPTDFTETNTCGATLASNAACTISATFTPAAAASYAATVTLTDNNNNVANSTQSIALSGTGSTNTTYHTLYVIPEADNSVTPLYALVNNAAKTIDMTMYALEDTTFTADLVAACKRGVVVRVILDQNSEKSGNTSAFNSLNAQTNCSAVWANKAFAVTHEKSIMIDGAIDVVMSLNLQSQYYSTTRDYALVDNDSSDYAADEATFSMDYAAGTTSTGVVGASDFSYQPGPGTDLVWSPTTATADMLAIINNSTKTLYIECEEFSASNIVSAVANAAQRGVAVVLVGENESSSYSSEYATIKAAGASVYYYSSSTGFYIHAKSVVADQGLSTEAVYMGSINYSTASLTENRELGVYITGNTTVSNPIAATLKATTITDESMTGVTHY